MNCIHTMLSSLLKLMVKGFWRWLTNSRYCINILLSVGMISGNEQDYASSYPMVPLWAGPDTAWNPPPHQRMGATGSHKPLRCLGQCFRTLFNLPLNWSNEQRMFLLFWYNLCLSTLVFCLHRRCYWIFRWLFMDWSLSTGRCSGSSIWNYPCVVDITQDWTKRG